VSGATNHLYFNEQRILEHGGTIAYHYTNMVTHVIGISQKNADVIRVNIIFLYFILVL